MIYKATLELTWEYDAHNFDGLTQDDVVEKAIKNVQNHPKHLAELIEVKRLPNTIEAE